MHNPNNKECHLNHCVGYKGDNHCLGGLDCICTCPTEQKEEWVEEWDKYSNVEIVDPVPFFCTQIAFAEERGRRDTITAFVEWAGKQEWLNKGDLLKFADSLKSNLTQKS